MTDIENPIVVIEYNNSWQSEFLKISEFMKLILDDKIIEVHHVGSTAVPNLAAKPILDIDIEMKDYDGFPEIARVLKNAGYLHKGNQGINDREVFKAIIEDEFMDFHLYVCPSYSKELKRHIAFRDHLRNNEEHRLEYSKLKRELSVLYRNNREAYTEAKSELIVNILKEIDVKLL